MYGKEKECIYRRQVKSSRAVACGLVAHSSHARVHVSHTGSASRARVLLWTALLLGSYMRDRDMKDGTSSPKEQGEPRY